MAKIGLRGELPHQLLHLPALSVSLFLLHPTIPLAASPAQLIMLQLFQPQQRLSWCSPRLGTPKFCLPWRPLVCDFFDRNLHLLRARHRLRFAKLTEQHGGRTPAEPVPLLPHRLGLRIRNVEPFISGPEPSKGAARPPKAPPKLPNLHIWLWPPSDAVGFEISGLAVTESVCSAGHCLASPRPLCIRQLRDRSALLPCKPLHSLRATAKTAAPCFAAASGAGSLRLGLLTGSLPASRPLPDLRGAGPWLHRCVPVSRVRLAQLRLFQAAQGQKGSPAAPPDRPPAGTESLAAVAQLGCASPAEFRQGWSAWPETCGPGAAALLYGGPPDCPGGASESERRSDPCSLMTTLMTVYSLTSPPSPKSPLSL
uniref:cDNA n=1 Tax=Macrostomum lignano TaxID=282301 RepID=A0A1I8F8K3_9PLAT